MLTPEAIYFMQTASPSPNYLKIFKNEILNIALQKSFIHTCRHIKTQEKKNTRKFVENTQANPKIAIF